MTGPSAVCPESKGQFAVSILLDKFLFFKAFAPRPFAICNLNSPQFWS